MTSAAIFTLLILLFFDVWLLKRSQQKIKKIITPKVWVTHPETYCIIYVVNLRIVQVLLCLLILKHIQLIISSAMVEYWYLFNFSE